MKTIPARVQHPRDTLANWSQKNPVLKQGEFALVDIGLNKTRLKAGNGTTPFNDLPFVEGEAGAYQGIATTTLVPNTASGKVWYFALPGTYTNFLDVNNNAIVVTSRLAILSFDNGVWYKADIITDQNYTYTTTRYIVRAGGTPSVDCDYTTISAALAAITDNTELKRYVIEVVEGEYNESIVCKNYVDIIGSASGSGKVVLYNTPAATGPDEETAYTIWAAATCTIRNIAIYGYKTQQCVLWNEDYPLFSQGDDTRVTTFVNCEIVNFGGAGSAFYGIQIHPFSYQKMNFINCRIYSDDNLIKNHADTVHRSNNDNWTVSFKGCNIHKLKIKDYLEYARNTVEFEGCAIKELQLEADTSVYTANPGNTVANRGFYPPLIRINEQANQLGKISYVGPYLTINGGVRIQFRDFSRFVLNKSGNPINEGKVLTNDATTGLPNAYTYGDAEYYPNEQVSEYAGSGRPYGVAMATISDDTVGTMNELKKHVIIRASFDVANGSVVRGDKLELTSNGDVAKQNTGDLFGYADDADSGGFVEMQIA